MNPDLTWLAELSEQKNKDGTPRFAAESLQDFVAVLLLSAKADVEQLPADLKRIVSAFVLKLGGVKLIAKPVELAAAMKAHLDAHPLPPELVAKLQAQFKDASAPGSDTKKAGSFRGRISG